MPDVMPADVLSVLDLLSEDASVESGIFTVPVSFEVPAAPDVSGGVWAAPESDADSPAIPVPPCSGAAAIDGSITPGVIMERNNTADKRMDRDLIF
ncbi:MAG: hypothetical protein Q4C60_10830 [Eubacteriales bacterium]|nr:hypothetical protein [Eubacteriales bacterium]